MGKPGSSQPPFWGLELRPEKVGKPFSPLRKTRRRLGPGWMLSFQDSHCQPWEFLEWSQEASSFQASIRKSRPSFEKASVIQHEMLSILHAEAPRIPRTRTQHRNTERVEKPMVAEVFPARLVLWAAKTWSHWPRWNLWECHLFYVQNQDQEEAVFNRCGHFFGGQEEFSPKTTLCCPLSLFLLWAPVVPIIWR